MGTGRQCQAGCRDGGARWGLNDSATPRVNWLRDGGDAAPPHGQRTQGIWQGKEQLVGTERGLRG